MNNVYYDNIHAYNGMQHTRYTTSIRNIIYSSFAEENPSDPLGGYKKMDEVIQRGRELIFDFDYGIINEELYSEVAGTFNLKDSFEKAFITKFISDEIGFESLVEFKAKLYGRLLTIVPILNIKFNTIMRVRFKDLFGGYDYTEHIENTHNDTDTDTGTVKDKGKHLGNRYPVNVVDALDELGDINYATDGSANTNNSTRDLTRQNDGGYITDRTVDRNDRNIVDNILKLNKLYNDLIQGALRELSDLFMGIL